MPVPAPPPFIVGLALSLFLLATGGYAMLVILRVVTEPKQEKSKKVKLRELKPIAKLVGSLTIASLVLGLFLETSALLELNGVSIPLGYVFYIYSEIPLTLGLLGLAYTLRLQFQMAKANQAI